MGLPWRFSGQDSVLPMQGAGPWTVNKDLTFYVRSHTHTQKRYTQTQTHTLFTGLTDI